MSSACLLAADLSRVRLLTGDADDVWHAPIPDDPDQPPALREVAALAADWINERLPGRRLDTVCLDVDEARCVWIAAPTREPAVIAAALRQRRADWGETDISGELVQPLVADAPAGAGASSGTLLQRISKKQSQGGGRVQSAAVLETPDAAVRLLLDALDIRGVRIGQTCTLWHTMLRQLDPAELADDAVDAVLMSDRPGRFVWAWASGGGLVAGGVCLTPTTDTQEPTDADVGAAVGRLTLDWLTWSAQIGREPERIRVLGASSRLTQAVQERWPSAVVTSVSDDALIRALLEAPADPAVSENDPRLSTPALTRRPSRSHRRAYRLAAIAIGLLAIGVVGLGVRSQQAVSRYEAARAQLNIDAQELVRQIAPGYESQPNLVDSLQSFFLILQRDNPQLPPPPEPQRIFEELQRVLNAAVQVDGATVNRISVDAQTCSAQFRIATYADGEQLMGNLERTASEEPGHLNWTERVTGSPPNLVQRLTGLWQ